MIIEGISKIEEKYNFWMKIIIPRDNVRKLDQTGCVSIITLKQEKT